MQPKTNDNTEEINDYLKTRIESLDLPKKIENVLINSSIRTIGGIMRKTESSLINIQGLGKKGLEDIQDRLKRYSEFYKRNKQKDLEIRSISKDLDEDPPVIEKAIEMIKENDVNDIIGTLAKHLNVKKETILSETRKREVVEVRNLMIYFLREYGEMSYPAIGRLIGGRDHTTIIHSYNKVAKSLDGKNDFEQKFSEMIEKVRSIKERKFYVENTIIPETIASIRAQIDLAKSNLQRRVIPERSMKILELYREGITIENIAKVSKITRQRVDQIVKRTIEQMAINDSISREIVIDSDILIDEERKKRRNLIHGKTHDSTPKPIPEKRWTRNYIACISCGTTIIPHVRRGLCEQCAGRFRGDRREQIIASYDNKCNSCGIFRHEAITQYKHDLYITKDRNVLCKMCFLSTTGKTLGGYKNYEWSRFYSNCQSCGMTSSPHFKQGLCEKCSNVLTDSDRESIILSNNEKCGGCGIGRDEAKNKLGRDFYITKNKEVLCRKCFQIMTIKKMRAKKNLKT